MKKDSLITKITYLWLIVATIITFSPQLSAQDLNSPEIVRGHINLAYTQPSFTYGSKDFTTMTIKEFDDIVNKKTYGELEIITQKDKSVVYDFIDDPGYPHIFGLSPIFRLRQVIFKPNDDRSIIYERTFDNLTEAQTTYNNIIKAFKNAGGKSIGKVKGFATSLAFTFKEFPGLTIRMIQNGKHVSLNFWYSKSSIAKEILTQIDNITKHPFPSMQKTSNYLLWSKKTVVNHLNTLLKKKTITGFDDLFADNNKAIHIDFKDWELPCKIGNTDHYIRAIWRSDYRPGYVTYDDLKCNIEQWFFLCSEDIKNKSELNATAKFIRETLEKAGGIVKKDEKMPAAYDAYDIIFPRKKISISKGIQTIHIIIHLQEFRKK